LNECFNINSNPFLFVFQELKSFSDHLKTLPEYSSGEGELEVNRKKNRYKDILPFDATRVLLSEYPGVPGSDYINANYIKGASGSNAYIASQGPLPHTVNDFWRLVVETEVQVIVMACNETEAGKHKCERYWNESSEDEEEEKQYGKYFVQTLKKREICPDFLVRTMRLRWTLEENKGQQQEERTVCQFHYSAWPDHGVPNQVKPLLEMVRLIRDCQASETLPVLIHCSAGCGRTGTICAIDFIWGLLRTGKLTSEFSLFDLVREMRRQRIAMVQTVDQYILVHRAVRELFLEQMRVIDSHPYENVDDDGNPLCKNNPDEVAPEYETIFVKVEEEEEKEAAADFDKILSARMSQTQPRMGTAMLSREKSPVLQNKEDQQTTPPPQPPPKQRSIDSTAIETRRVDVAAMKDSSEDLAPIADFTKLKDPVLFEPAKPAETTKDVAAAQRYKKGHLRLTKTDNGSWKLEELEEKMQKAAAAAAAERKKNNDGGGGGGGGGRRKKKSNGTSEESKLMRRPSIKKIRAFFNKEKEPLPHSTSSGSSSAKSSPPAEFSADDDSPPNSESELASALSKLPKFEVVDSKFETTYSSPPNSMSVPSSLDRKARDPDYANVASFDPGSGGGKFWSLSTSSRLSKDETNNAPSGGASSSSLRSSHSSERLILASAENKPTLPIKRSKSMKTVAVNPVTTGDYSLPPQKQQKEKRRDHLPPRRLSAEAAAASKDLSFQSLPPDANFTSAKDQQQQPPTKPKRMNSYGNANAVTRSLDAPPRKYSNDYANVRIRRDLKQPASEKSFLEQQLVKLHERITTSTSVPSDLKKTLPLIAKSSDSLDEDAKRMLKDCQGRREKETNLSDDFMSRQTSIQRQNFVGY
jgi:protein tyrosine phosphatase